MKTLFLKGLLCRGRTDSKRVSKPIPGVSEPKPPTAKSRTRLQRSPAPGARCSGLSPLREGLAVSDSCFSHTTQGAPDFQLSGPQEKMAVSVPCDSTVSPPRSRAQVRQGSSWDVLQHTSSNTPCFKQYFLLLVRTENGANQSPCIPHRSLGKLQEDWQ